jgi:uncharacterized coiled-coil DUF342 family protein
MPIFALALVLLLVLDWLAALEAGVELADELGAELTGLAEELTELAEELTELVEELTELAEELTELVEELAELVEEPTGLAGELTGLAGELTELAAELAAGLNDETGAESEESTPPWTLAGVTLPDVFPAAAL